MTRDPADDASPSTAPNPSVALARTLVDELVRLGLRHVCLAPGSRSTALATAAFDHDRVTVHVGIDERSLAFLAVGLARGGDGPAAVLSTSGTAAVNFHPAVVEAHESRVPLLVLTADRPPELRHAGANQSIDQIKLYGDAVRLFVEVGVPHDHDGANSYWRSTACHAWAAARGDGGPPGPVHCNLAFREPLIAASDDGRSRARPFRGALDGRPDGRPWTTVTGAEPSPAGDELDQLLGRIRRARRPLLVVGDTPADPTPLVELATAAGWPLIAEAHSGARYGPNAIGAYHHLVSHAPFAADHRPDLVLRVGRVALSRPLLGLLEDTHEVLVDPDGRWLDPGRALDRLVVATPRTLTSASGRRRSRQAGQTPRGARGGPGGDVDALGEVEDDWLASWRRADRRARAAIDDLLDADDGLSEPCTARDVAATLPAGGHLVAASSMPIRDLDRFMGPREDVRVIANRGASGIDGFVSTALGVALSGTGPTVALAGDLSLLHDSGGLLLLEERPDLVIVVVNNDGGGIFHFLPQADGRRADDGQDAIAFERLFGTSHGRDLGSLATLHDLSHVRAESPGELRSAVSAGIAAGGLHLVEVVTERRANAALHRRLQRAVGTALNG